MAIDLSNVKVGPAQDVPLRMVLAGSPGVGKTTFACRAPRPIVIQTEDGLEPLIRAEVLPESVARFPLAKSYDEVLDALRALYREEHDFKTVVLDSLDWFEPLLWQKTCAEHGKTSIEEFGYGKGYIEAEKQWRKFLDALNILRADKKLHIILLAHTEIRRFESPDEQPYDRYELKLHKRAARMVEEWSDICATARFKNLITTRTEGAGAMQKKIGKAVGGGERILHLAERPSAVAKNRLNLPAEIDFDWDTFSSIAKIGG